MVECEGAPDLKKGANMADTGRYTIHVIGLLTECKSRHKKLAEYAKGQ